MIHHLSIPCFEFSIPYLSIDISHFAFHISHLYIEWAGRAWLLGLLIPLGIVFAWWGYSRSVPEVSVLMRWILTTIRGLIVIFILILLFDPVVNLVQEKSRPTQLAVLIDNSASMGMESRSENRPEALKELLSRDNIRWLEKNFSVKYSLFSDTSVEVEHWTPDSIEFSGAATDIAAVLRQSWSAMEDRNGAVLLISDGAHNTGANPSRLAAQSPARVFTVAVGDSNPQVDLSIAEIKVNPLVYMGDEVPLNARIRGYPGAVTNLELRTQNGDVLQSQPVIFKDGKETRLDFKFIAEEEGDQVYELYLAPLEEENTVHNNKRHFAVKMLKSRIKILLLAGCPSPDLAFIRRILARNHNLELSVRIERKDGSLYPAEELQRLKDYDLLMMLNYPTAASDQKVLDDIVRAVQAKLPMVIIAGDLIEPRRLNPVKEFLPVTWGRGGKEKPVCLFPQEMGISLTNFFPQGLDWGSLPLVRYRPGLLNLRGDATILASFDDKNPAMGYITSAGEKVLAVLAYEMWRLVLQDPEHSQGDSLVSNFWHSAIRWLSTREEEELFRINTGKSVYPGGERIHFSARLFDRAYKPLSGAEINLIVNGPEGALTIPFVQTGEGEYSASARFYEEGEYRYQGMAFAGNDTLTCRGRLTVEAFNPELLDPAMRPDQMRGIAEKSGGNFYLPGDFDKFFEDYIPPPVKYSEKREIKIFPRMAALITIILLLSLEWFIRKRKGML